MIPTTRNVARSLVAAASVGALASGVALAGAQVPGGNPSGFVVNVDDTSLVVTVADKGEEPTSITGTIENTTGHTFRCEVPQMDIGGALSPVGYGQVTTAEVAKETTTYYRENVFTGPTLTNANGTLLSMGSVYDLTPVGSAIGSAESDTRQPQNSARVAGRTGNPTVGGNLQFNVGPDATVEYTADLGPSATGDRGQWQSAAIFMCRNNTTNNWFIYSGYEQLPDGTVTDDPAEATGSLQSGSLGSS